MPEMKSALRKSMHRLELADISAGLLNRKQKPPTSPRTAPYGKHRARVSLLRLPGLKLPPKKEKHIPTEHV